MKPRCSADLSDTQRVPASNRVARAAYGAIRVIRTSSAAYLAALALAIPLLAGPASAPRGAEAGALPGGVDPGALATTQDFQDVPTNSSFYTYLHNLHLAGVVAGYPCGGTGQPCVPPANLPYYRPGNPVTRLQMTKFIDLGRRNITDAVGTSLVMSTTSFWPGLVITSTAPGAVISTTYNNAINASTSSIGEAVYARCERDGINCYALEGSAGTGSYRAYLVGGKGVYARSDDQSYAAVKGQSTGYRAYGGDFSSDNYISLHVGNSMPTNYDIQLLVDGNGDPSLITEDIHGTLYIAGDLTVTGSKTGYVVDAMQNGDIAALEPGDVAVVAGPSAPPVIGEIPVPVVRRATEANDTDVVGVVDQVLYVPDAKTKAAYDLQQKAIQAAQTRRDQMLSTANAQGTKPDLSQVAVPPATITDAKGMVHAVTGATQVPVEGYANVVTLGSYKAVKVDASYGAIRPGDLLTTSPHAGYAMKVQNKVDALGAAIGKALGSLDQGTSTIPVLVTLR